MAKRNAYQISRINKSIDSLGEAAVFAMSDVNSECMQVEIINENLVKPALTSHHGLCRFLRGPFRLWDALTTFLGTMDVALSADKLQFVAVYLGDSVVSFRFAANHIDHVKHVVTILRDAGVTVKLKKCNFFINTADHLGHVICARCFEIASHMAEVMASAMCDAINL